MQDGILHPQSGAADGAGIVLKLYELRTEPTLREARAWFAFDFHPASAADVLAAWLGPGHGSGRYRMVTTYWDMACAMVVHGAVDAAMFNAANTEHVALYAKMRPFLPEVRAATGYADYLEHVERVVLAMPDAEHRIAIFERYMQRQAKFAADAATGAGGKPPEA